MQRAELVAAHDGGFGALCLVARGVGNQGDDGIEFWVDAGNRGEMSVEHLNRAHRLGCNQRRQFDGRLATQVFSHDGSVICRPVHEATFDREEQEVETIARRAGSKNRGAHF